MTLIYAYIVRKKTGKPSIYWADSKLLFRTKNFCIPRFWRNLNIFIHQGKKHVRRQVFAFMIGHKIGEFCLTRKPFHYPPKKKKR
jgi:ribosomal protein S19